MKRTIWLGGLLALLPLLTAGAAQAQWRQEQRSEFTNDCIASCRNNPRVSSQRERCEQYCWCVVEEGERRYTAIDYDEIDRDARAGRQTRILGEFSSLFQICSNRAFRN